MPTTGRICLPVKLAATLTKLIEHDEIEPVIVVALHATRDRLQEYGTADIPNARGLGKKARKYAWFVLDEVMPYINRHFRTLPGPINTAIIGWSLGGLMALDMAWNYRRCLARWRFFRLAYGGAPKIRTCIPSKSRASCIAACAIPKCPAA